MVSENGCLVNEIQKIYSLTHSFQTTPKAVSESRFLCFLGPEMGSRSTQVKIFCVLEIGRSPSFHIRFGDDLRTTKNYLT